MKKLLSIVLAVAMIATLGCFNVSAAETHSLLPANASDFSTAEGGDGTVTVTADGDGYKFSSTQGWPNAYYVDESNWLYVNENDDLYLHFDFEVVSGATNVIVYFAGQSPTDQASVGSFICLNGVVDPSYVNPLTGDAVTDLPVGKYSGSVALADLGYREDLKDDEGNMLISGCKVFAVGGETVVNELSIGPAKGTDSSTDDSTDGTTAAKTTAADKDSDSKETGDATQAVTFAVIAMAAAAVVTLSVVASKKAKAR